MFLLVLSLCLRVVSGAGSSEEETTTETTIELFERYAGNLTYSNNEDGSCIACSNGSCNEDSAVSPHSWTAVLELEINNEIYYNDEDGCRGYAKDVAEFGVVAFTWKNSSRQCSLHVLAETHNINAKMHKHNAYVWVEENPNNTGPLFLVRYPTSLSTEEIDAVCYYGLNINNTPNVVMELNMVIIITVVIIIISWNVWMNHTENYPPFFGDGHVLPEASDDNSYEKQMHNIYTKESSQQSKEE